MKQRIYAVGFPNISEIRDGLKEAIAEEMKEDEEILQAVVMKQNSPVDFGEIFAKSKGPSVGPHQHTMHRECTASQPADELKILLEELKELKEKEKQLSLETQRVTSRKQTVLSKIQTLRKEPEGVETETEMAKNNGTQVNTGKSPFSNISCSII